MSTPTIEILVGDALKRLRKLPSNSVHCIVTSPPYYGLRDYGVAGQLGLEETPAKFIRTMVRVFREVHRVLRPDGTCWVNMGDSYAGTGDRDANIRTDGTLSYRSGGKGMRPKGFKPKDMMGMPWRLALALQADGWWLRQDIIWHKPNPMPESAKDRCTKAHEYLFLLTKSARYHWNAEAILEPVSGTANSRGNGVNAKAKAPEAWDTSKGEGHHGSVHKKYAGTGVGWGYVEGEKPRTTGKTPGANSRVNVTRDAKGRPPQSRQNESFSAAVSGLVDERNKRSVWTVPTFPCKEAHFATFPPDLIKPCILAGCPAGGVVLDPFGGSGTTGMVALELGRSAILIELNPDYAEIARRRCDVTPGFAFASGEEAHD